MQQAIKPITTESIEKPRGGYRMISVPQICLIWRAYKSRLFPKFHDVRVYLALHEIDERRAVENRKRRRRRLALRRFAIDRGKLVAELQELVEGLNPRLISASLRRLQRTGMVDITRHPIVFAQRPSELRDPELDGYDQMLRRVDRRETVHGRGVPIPRRMLRYLARESTPGVAATLLGHAIRCLWLHRSAYRFVGTCPVRFVAEVFESNRRTVIRARQYLTSPAVRWLVPLVTAPHVRQRYGSRVAINPRWTRPAKPSQARLPSTHCDLPASTEPRSPELSGCAAAPALTPSGTRKDTDLSPPIETKNLLTEVQQPGTGRKGRRGVCERALQGAAPSLDRITAADLRLTERLEELLAQARHRGWVGRASADRLAFFAAAEHALRVGTRNPPGLFATILRRGLWSYVTQSDEDGACCRLSRAESGLDVSDTERRPPSAPGTPNSGRATDADSPTAIGTLISEVASACAMVAPAPGCNDPRLSHRTLFRKVA